MNKIIQFGLLVLLVSQVYCDPDICVTFNQEQCAQNNSCQWVKTTDSSCQNFECSSLNTNKQDCLNKKSSCSWSDQKPAFCEVKANYCTVSTDTPNTCTDTTNCSYVAATQASCSVKGSGFGCSAFNVDSCPKQDECQWITAICKNSNFCSQQPSASCTTQNGCQFQAKTCKHTPEAENCQNITDKTACGQANCVYDDQANVCTRPTCSVSNNCSDALCMIDIGTCQTTPNKCNTFDTKDNCSALQSCTWVETPFCQDKPNYCTVDTCDKTFCVSTPAAPSTCAPNNDTNICKTLLQADCGTGTTADQCSFNAGSPATCANIQKCGTFPVQNQCAAQVGCSWDSISMCQAAGSSQTSAVKMAASLLLVALSLFI